MPSPKKNFPLPLLQQVPLEAVLPAKVPEKVGMHLLTAV